MKLLHKFKQYSFINLGKDLSNTFINFTKSQRIVNLCMKTYTDNKVNHNNIHIYNPNKPAKFIGRKMNEFFDFHKKNKNKNINWDIREKQLINQRSFMATQNNLYIKMMMKWQIELLRRKRRKAKTKENFEKYVSLIKFKSIPEPMDEKLVTHPMNKEMNVNLNPNDDQIFAVIKYKGFQHKVIKDDLIMLDIVPINVGESFLIDNVLLIGSKDFTAVGRPLVKNAKVLCTLEEVRKTDKVIIFKKKRRKGYQKNQSHRQTVYMVRVDKVIYEPDELVTKNYKSLF